MGKKLTASGSFTVATIEDGVSVEARYAPNNNPTPSQIHTTWRDGDIYMSTRESDSSVWSDWHKMVGESGGETVYSFNISKEKTSGGATTAPSNCISDTWQDTPISPTSAYPYLWMKIQKKDGDGNNVGDASYARVTGELGIDYEIRCAIDSIKIPKDTTSTSVTTTFNFYYKESGKPPIAYNAYYGIYYRIGTAYTLISNGSSSSASLSAYSVDNTKTAIVVFIFSASYSDIDPTSQSYLAKLELPIYEDGKDGLSPNPNILLRTVFDRGIDKVKEKWTGDWNYVGIDAASDTVIDGRKSIRISAEYASTYKDFTQNVYGRIKTDTWYTFSFYYYSTSTFWTYIYDGENTYGIVDRTAGYYIDGVYNSGDLDIDGQHQWNWEWMGKRHSITFKTKSSFGTTNALILFRCPQGVQVAICMPKLEIGKDATTYIPNEDDLVGNDGQSIRGKTGRFYYYAQEWSSDPNVSYAVTDAEAPYFLYQGNYWVFNPTNNGTYTMSSMGTPSSSNANWELMVTDFKYLITEAIFTDFAKLGSGVFNKDWLLSAYGKREKVLKSSSSSINQGTNFNYIQVPNMTSIDVIEGNIYSFYITWYSASGYSLLARVAISTDGGSNYDTTEEFYSSNYSTSHVDVLSFRARFTGKATLFYCGSGTITKVVTYDDSTISGTNTGYRKFTPSFPNTDYVHINASNAGQGIGSTTYSYVSLSKFTVVQGMTYKLQMDGIIQSGSGTCYVSVYKYSDNTPINLYGAENTEGVYYSTTTDGGYYRMYFDSNSTRITKAASFTPNFSGEIVVMGRISSSGVVGDLQNMILIPVNPFVPKVAIDWLSGYAHFGGGKERFEPDGSGQLAGGNIKWDENGYGQLAGGGITWDANKLNVQGRITADMLFAKSLWVRDANYTVDLENNPYNMYYVVNAGHDITLPLAGSYGGVILRFASLISKPQGGSTTVYGIKLITSSSDYIWVKDGWGAYARSYDTVYIQNFQIVSIAAVGSVWIVMSGMVGASPEPMPA